MIYKLQPNDKYKCQKEKKTIKKKIENKKNINIASVTHSHRKKKTLTCNNNAKKEK